MRLSERLRAYRAQRAARARQRAYANEGANEAYRERPSGPGPGGFAPVPYDPGGFAAAREAELDEQLRKQREGEGS